MYESISGILKSKDPQRAIVEAAGIGYRLAIPLSTYTALPHLESPVQLYLSQVVREDSNTLYAFAHREDRDLFETLTTISGIGPKTAISIIGHMNTTALQRAVAAADTVLLSKLPGIGKKTAERLVIEMRDKFKEKKGKSASIVLPAGDMSGDAINALIHLGYNPIDAQKAVHRALGEKKEETDLGLLITAALQKI
jgi:holliday junction DNA helicase RuvA